jgi:hypothetical protein
MIYNYSNEQISDSNSWNRSDTRICTSVSTAS